MYAFSFPILCQTTFQNSHIILYLQYMRFQLLHILFSCWPHQFLKCWLFWNACGGMISLCGFNLYFLDDKWSWVPFPKLIDVCICISILVKIFHPFLLDCLFLCTLAYRGSLYTWVYVLCWISALQSGFSRHPLDSALNEQNKFSSFLTLP